MRRLVAAIAILTGLTLGHVTPAEAAPVGPAQIVIRTWGTCSVEAQYFNYGGTAVADHYLRTQGCTGYTSVTVYAIRNGRQVARECNMITAVFAPGTVGCQFLFDPLLGGWRAYVDGAAWGMRAHLCYPAQVPLNPCQDFNDSVYG
jgi:hypothetical protein